MLKKVSKAERYKIGLPSKFVIVISKEMHTKWNAVVLVLR